LPGDRTPYLVTELIGPIGMPLWEAQKCSMNRVWPAQLPEGAGSWNTWIALGEDKPEYVGLDFKVTLVLVDEKAKRQFEEYIENAERVKKYPGVRTDAFEGAVEEVASIKLTRK